MNQLGYIQNVDTGNSVPIYGQDTLDLVRAQDWEIKGILGQEYVVSWKGSTPVEQDLNFELLAGYADVPDRAALKYFIGVFHAMCAPRMAANGRTRTPPAVRLVLSGYINCVGVLRNVRVSARGPWELNGVVVAESESDGGLRSGLLPTSAVFSGTFVLIPGFQNNGLVDVSSNASGLSMENVEESLYDIKV